MFEPIKVTAYLQCGVIADAFLPIDAVLYYQALREANGPQLATIPGASSGGRNGHLRLKVINGGTDQWYFAASFAQPRGTVAQMTDYWSKRFDQQHSDLIDFGGKRGKVIVEAGRYKAYRMPVFLWHALAVDWYVVGDIDWVRHMLCTVTNLGKKGAQGHGAILRWEIQPFRHDWSVYGPNNRLMRAIPADTGPIVGYKPSYWLPRNQAPCRLP